MTDEDKKKIVSEPPPPTDEIDGEWGDDDQTLVRELPEGVSKVQPAPPAADSVAQTAVAPISVPTPAAASPEKEDEDEDEDEDEAHEDEETTDNEDEEDEEDGADAEPAHAATAGVAADWIPEWAPFAVLGLLVTASIVFGLGLLGGPSGEHVEEEAAAPAASAVAPAKKKPGTHP
jgi:hypothetical protein